MILIRKAMYWFLARYFYNQDKDSELPVEEIRYYQRYKGKFYVISMKRDDDL